MLKKLSFILLAILSTLVGFYPYIYFLVDRKFGLLQSKTEAVLTNVFWNVSFYQHITLGGLALLIGWTQFVTKFRARRLKLHRQLGKVYVVAVLLSAIAGVHIAFYATGGIVPSLGFIGLGLVWFCTTLKAYIHIRKGRVEAHRKMMIYSYAACLAAVTLRIYLPLLTLAFHDFVKAYALVAWLCWVPNLIVAYFLVKQLSHQSEALVSFHPRHQVKAI